MKRSSARGSSSTHDRRRLVLAPGALGPLGGRRPYGRCRAPSEAAAGVGHSAVHASVSRAMTSYLRRLLRTGAAYQLADAVSKVVALALLPLYTRHLTRADYGTAELLLTTIILVSIILRLGLGEAFVRFHFLDADPERRRRAGAHGDRHAVRRSRRVAALAVAIVRRAGRRARCWARRSPDVIRAAALGLWAFTNLELAYALLRVEERARAFAIASLINVALTVALTVWLVVVARRGRARPAARQLRGLRGRAARPVVVRARGARVPPGGIERAQLGPMLRFGLPTVPAEVSVFALFFVDRLWLYRAREPGRGRPLLARRSSSPASSSSPCARSSTRGRRWPTRSSPTTPRRRASTPASRPTTCCSPASSSPGSRCSAAGSCGCSPRRSSSPPTRRCRGSRSAGRCTGCSWCWWRWPGRAQVTVRNAPAALCGLAVNVALLALLVPPLGIAGAGLALVGAYVVMLVVMWVLTRNLFPVAFEWGRLALLRGRRRRARGRGRAAAADRRRRRASSRRALVLAAIPLALWRRALLPAGRAARPPAACSGARQEPSAAG